VKSSRFFAYLQLMRPANIVTAMADILAGVAVVSWSILLFSEIFNGSAIEGFRIQGLPSFLHPFAQQVFKYAFQLSFIIETGGRHLSLLLLATIGLYGGGVVFNDVFDAKLDAVERPERPIPSGRATLQGATILGGVLLLAGILFAFLVSTLSGIVAILIAFFALLYNKIGKHQSWGPLNMGLCRGLNLFLGTTIMDALTAEQISNVGIAVADMGILPFGFILVPLIPILYIAAITSVSRGEVHGGSKKSFYLPFALYGVVVLAILAILFWTTTPVWQSLPFWAFFCYLIFPPLIRAYRDPQPRNIGMAVKAGVIALIAMDAAIAAAFAGILYGLIVLALLPLSRFLAKSFAVT
jgi:4-hydroxybenzoate polyprenyltransferase